MAGTSRTGKRYTSLERRSPGEQEASMERWLRGPELSEERCERRAKAGGVLGRGPGDRRGILNAEEVRSIEAKICR